MWSTTQQQPIPNEWTSPMNSQWQSWNVVSKQSGWPEAPSANLNGFSTSWTPVVEPHMQSKAKIMPKSNNPVDSVGMSNQQQQFYFMPVSTQSSWDYVVPAPMTAMKKDVQVIVAPQQKPRPQADFVNVKTAPNPWGAKSPKKTVQEEEPVEEDGDQKGKKNEIEDELTQQSLYKTELCRSWTETGACRYGNKCQFAHGKDEVRQIMRHPKYKTEICKTFHTQGTCPYGTRCRFIHNPSLRASHLQQQQQQQQQFPVETVAKSLEHAPTLPAAVTPPQMIPQPAHSIWSTPLLVPSPVSEVPIESAFGALSLSPTSPASPDDLKFGRLPIFQRFTN